ncbi:hypothetical protein DPMN_008677 [Dreissena polymorpha]|uniref:Uncharacterized protein n=1 Tax=Dreissena polymorpha TaxID=45954 RepID=A0A9D4MY86_DREPO|nr:hypothetical protein DPMN_008677 [Dreissena polymorpha]
MPVHIVESSKSEFYWELIDSTSFLTNVGTNGLISGCRDKEPKSWTVQPRSGQNCPPPSSHKNAPPTGGHVFSPIPTIFKLVRDINKTNVLTNFHDDWAKIVTSRVLTRENCHYIHIEKNAPPTGGQTSIEPMKTAPPTGGHIFQRIGTTFELNQDIIKTNILLHEDWASNVTSTVFTSFELGRDFIGTKLLTKFHEDGTRNVFTSKYRSQKLT